MSESSCMYRCQTSNCGCLYDPKRGDRRGKISAGTCFEDLPENWKCPVCGASKKMFQPIPGTGTASEKKDDQAES